jgi:hypothetical protein
MAQMIPDRLPDKASRGEGRVFSILKNLPDDCIVYYEPVIRNRYPDFIVIIPSVGVLVIYSSARKLDLQFNFAPSKSA